MVFASLSVFSSAHSNLCFFLSSILNWLGSKNFLLFRLNLHYRILFCKYQGIYCKVDLHYSGFYFYDLIVMGL